MCKSICLKPAHFVFAQMAELSSLFQVFIGHGMYNFKRKLNIQDYYVRTSPLGFITTFHYNPLVHSTMFVFNCIC